MPLITLIVYLIIVGLLLWVVNELPLDATIKKVIQVVVIVVVVLWLLQIFVPALPNFYIGRHS
jgi:hypothetical protein